MQLTEEDRKELTDVLRPRLTPYIPHVPTSKQQLFMWWAGLESLFGGAAGGGKTDCLLMSALQYSDVPGYSALILRKSYKDLALPDAIMDRSQKWLRATRAQWKSDTYTWTFPSGARVTFGHLKRFKHVYQYQGAAFQFVGFDELTQFEEACYRYLFSRIRRPVVPCEHCHRPVETIGDAPVHSPTAEWTHSSDKHNEKCGRAEPDPATLAEYAPSEDGVSVFDVPLRMRATSNPGGIGHRWVKRRFLDEGEDEGRLYVPARVQDNPYLDTESYADSMSELNEVTRKQLLEGSWEVSEPGAMFDRDWFPRMDNEPRDPNIDWVRCWDLAATQPNRSNRDPDYTVGFKMGMKDGVYYVSDIRRFRTTPATVKKKIRRTAQEDGKEVAIGIEQEGGASGKQTLDTYRRQVVPGYNVVAVPAWADKQTRAKPFSSAAEAGNIVLCATSRWNVTEYLDELEAFPDGEHDDQVDGGSGAMYMLTEDLGTSQDYSDSRM